MCTERKISNAPQAIADVKYTDMGPIEDEIARFKKHAAGAFAEQFMTAPSPGIVATTMMNAHYDSHEAYRERARARDARRNTARSTRPD